MKIKVGFGWLSFELDLSFEEFLNLLNWLHKIFPFAKVKVLSDINTCYSCKHFHDPKYCDEHGIGYDKTQVTCSGWEKN